MAKPILVRILVGAGIVDDGVSALQIAGAERFVAMSTPSVPASGSLLLYGKTVAGRTQLHVMPDSSGEYALQPAFWKKTIGMATAYYNGTSLSYFGMGTGTTIGTNTARSYVTTTLASRSLRWGNVSAATAGALCGFYFTTSWMVMGDGATTGRGFYWQGRFSVSDAATVSGARMFAGLTSSTSAPTNVEPNTLTNCVGLAQLSSDSTQLYLVYGGTTAQTAVPLGTNFPVQETPGSAAGGALYDLHIYSDPAKNGQITVQVDRVGTTYSFTQTIASSGSSAILPAAGTRMGPTIWRTNNATALPVGIDVNRFYHELEL